MTHPSLKSLYIFLKAECKLDSLKIKYFKSQQELAFTKNLTVIFFFLQSNLG